MATTAQKVFEKAMYLMDNADETTGLVDTPDNLEYKNRTVPIINILLQECFNASDTAAASDDGTRTIPTELTALTDSIPLDDGICRNVLPYGLASYLSLNENAAAASFFNQKYQENLARCRAAIPVVFSDIEDIYEGCSISDGVTWG